MSDYTLRCGGVPPHKGQIRSHSPAGRRLILTAHRRGGWYFREPEGTAGSGWINDNYITRMYPWIHTPKIPDVDTGADGNNNQAKDKQ